ASGLLFVCPTTTTSSSTTNPTSSSSTTSTSTSSTSTTTSNFSTSTTSTSSTTTSTTIAGFTKLRLSLKQGTTDCGQAGLDSHCTSGDNLGGTDGLGACTVNSDCGTVTPTCITRSGAASPFAGQLNDGAATKLTDLGAGCLYSGGGGGINVPGVQIPI